MNTLTFGRYAGKSIEEVLSLDLAYLKFLFSNDFLKEKLPIPYSRIRAEINYLDSELIKDFPDLEDEIKEHTHKLLNYQNYVFPEEIYRVMASFRTNQTKELVRDWKDFTVEEKYTFLENGCSTSLHKCRICSPIPASVYPPEVDSETESELISSYSLGNSLIERREFKIERREIISLNEIHINELVHKILDSYVELTKTYPKSFITIRMKAVLSEMKFNNVSISVNFKIYERAFRNRINKVKEENVDFDFDLKSNGKFKISLIWSDEVDQFTNFKESLDSFSILVNDPADLRIAEIQTPNRSKSRRSLEDFIRENFSNYEIRVPHTLIGDVIIDVPKDLSIHHSFDRFNLKEVIHYGENLLSSHEAEIIVINDFNDYGLDLIEFFECHPLIKPGIMFIDKFNTDVVDFESLVTIFSELKITVVKI